MDPKTLEAYATNAQAIARRHRGAADGVSRHFHQAFSPGDRILEIGSGAGRDLSSLVSEGWTAYGAEPVAEMRAESIRAYPHLDGLVFNGGLPDSLPGPGTLGGPFDGVLCSAVLQHLPRAALFDAVFNLRDILRPGGRALVSIPAARDDVDGSGRDDLGRLFNGVQAGELELLFQRVGFRTVGKWIEADGLDRPGLRWATLLFDCPYSRGDQSVRPLDRIEAVLQRDKKVSTYKLALLRALAEIATAEARTARWRPDGKVAVPIGAVAERWLEYYWQIFDSDLFLPQMNGEIAAGAHTLAFAKELDRLREKFDRGGLPAFLSNYRRGTLDSDADQLLRKLNSKLKTAIRSGPVHYAGRSTSGPLFDYEGGKILVSGELWQEVTLMSHWVRDSLLVRWAELTARFSAAGTSENDPPDRVLEGALRVLLTPALGERHTQHAREVFEAIPSKRCVWSNRMIGDEFDVDHVIPFSLWRNNDLWNLAPADKSINNQKRDLLPERRLLTERRSIIIEYWQCLAESLPRQFEVELRHLTGGDGSDYEGGFEALIEAVETTALQRGCARWAP